MGEAPLWPRPAEPAHGHKAKPIPPAPGWRLLLVMQLSLPPLLEWFILGLTQWRGPRRAGSGLASPGSEGVPGVPLSAGQAHPKGPQEDREAIWPLPQLPQSSERELDAT